MQKFLQCNINHCWQAQDLLIQYIKENSIDFCLVSEPVTIPSSPCWLGSLDKTAAVTWCTDRVSLPCSLLSRGNGFVVLSRGDLIVVSCYCSPNVSLARFLSFLDDLERALISVPGATPLRFPPYLLLGGDMNAKSTAWGSPFTDARGDALQDWAARWGLCLANTGTSPTCVRPQDVSFVDVTWTSWILAGRLHCWTVLEEVESLSDHLYISFEVGVYNERPGRPSRGRFPRWTLSGMNTELFQEVLSWLCSSSLVDATVEDYARRASRIMTNACDVAARRIGFRPRRVSTYWWNNTIAEARRLCVARRRAWTRARRGSSSALAAAKQRQYRLARNILRSEIKKAKALAWSELIASIDEDPWGLPYRLVMGRLRAMTPGMTASLRPEILKELLDSLFPPGVAHDPREPWMNYRWDDCWSISTDEVTSAIRDARSRGGRGSSSWPRWPATLCLEEGTP